MTLVVITRLPPPKNYMPPIHKVYGTFSDRQAAEIFTLKFVKANPCGICIIEPLLAPDSSQGEKP
jgi:hypothetical protein